MASPDERWIDLGVYSLDASLTPTMPSKADSQQSNLDQHDAALECSPEEYAFSGWHTRRSLTKLFVAQRSGG